MSIEQNILRKRTGLWSSGVTLSYLRPHCHCFLLEDHIWWVSAGHGKNRAVGGVRLVAASMIGGLRKEYWSYMTLRIPEKQQLFELMGTAAHLRKPDQRTEAHDQPADRWRVQLKKIVTGLRWS